MPFKNPFAKKKNYQYEKLGAWLECPFYIKDHQPYTNKVLEYQ